jgi:hypothetical protein
MGLTIPKVSLMSNLKATKSVLGGSESRQIHVIAESYSTPRILECSETFDYQMARRLNMSAMENCFAASVFD